MNHHLVYLAATSLLLFSLPLTKASSKCNDPCQTMDDCAGQLICINGKCNDLQGSTPTCTQSRSGGEGGQFCNSRGPRSPPLSPSGTKAILTLNDFSVGGNRGVPPKCDQKYHPLPERVVALSTGWFQNHSRCGKMIKIIARNGRSVVAKVVDECDSVNGCDNARGYQPPCRTNIIDASATVWTDLNVDKDKGEVAVAWSIL